MPFTNDPGSYAGTLLPGADCFLWHNADDSSSPVRDSNLQSILILNPLNQLVMNSLNNPLDNTYWKQDHTDCFVAVLWPGKHRPCDRLCFRSGHPDPLLLSYVIRWVSSGKS